MDLHVRPLRRARAQAGFTLLEVALVLAITGIGILAVALGLLAAVNTDGRANRQQRINLAVTNLVDAVRRTDWVVPASCFAVSSPPPTSADTATALSANNSHAARIMERLVADPGVASWTSRVTFKITDVTFWNPAVSAGDGFQAGSAKQLCDSNSGTLPNLGSYPVARLTVQGCWRSDDADGCDDDSAVVTSTAALRGSRVGGP